MAFLEAGGGTIAGALIAFLGLKSKIRTIEKRHVELAKNVVYCNVFKEFKESYEKEQKSQNSMLGEIRNDIKSLIKR